MGMCLNVRSRSFSGFASKYLILQGFRVNVRSNLGSDLTQHSCHLYQAFQFRDLHIPGIVLALMVHVRIYRHVHLIATCILSLQRFIPMCNLYVYTLMSLQR